eukprot:scaffold47234_cov18-Tisochrysis_lutea.AAC.3
MNFNRVIFSLLGNTRKIRWKKKAAVKEEDTTPATKGLRWQASVWLPQAWLGLRGSTAEYLRNV